MSASRARELLASVIGARLADRIDETADLAQAGVDSGAMIRLAALIERRCDAELTADDLTRLRTLAGVEAVLVRIAP